LKELISPRKQLRELQIRPKKRLGQHFVVDPNILRKIVDCAGLETEDIIVEIGAGLGTLTAPLAARVQKVYALEVDQRLADVLRDQFPGSMQVEIIPEDALRYDFSALFQQWRRKMKVVANLPYEISSPMIFRLFEERHCFSLFVLMLQMEVARKIVARPGTKEYGPLSLWSQLYSRPRVLFVVSPKVFHPRPKVESAVVKFEILEEPAVEVGDERTLRRVIRSAFAHRRKTLTNAIRLGEFSHLSAEKIQQALQSAGIDPALRGEMLSLEQFRDLAQALSAVE
jgi:16S rRNA (adenine1518-N6/adenine1519-N6)-dimethyltransferase